MDEQFISSYKTNSTYVILVLTRSSLSRNKAHMKSTKKKCMERTSDVTITVNLEYSATVRSRGRKSLTYPIASLDIVVYLVILDI